jgi:hypothetical protein
MRSAGASSSRFDAADLVVGGGVVGVVRLSLLGER